MNSKFKNLHYLNMYPGIETEFRTAVEMLETSNAAESFFHLKMCVLGLETLLIKDTEWAKSNKKVGYKPTHDEILKRLEKDKILNTKQIDLFTTVNNLSESYNYYDNNKLKKKQKIETLNILCTRLDNEIPSIMAHLGVGGSSRINYLNIDAKDLEVEKSETKEETPKKITKQTSKVKEPKPSKIHKPSLYIRLRYHWITFTRWFNKSIGFVIKFVLVSLVFAFLVNVTFINKDSSEHVKDLVDEYSVKEKKYIDSNISNIPDAIGDNLDVVGDCFVAIGTGIAKIIEFLKFE